MADTVLGAWEAPWNKTDGDLCLCEADMLAKGDTQSSINIVSKCYST